MPAYHAKPSRLQLHSTTFAIIQTRSGAFQTAVFPGRDAALRRPRIAINLYVHTRGRRSAPSLPWWVRGFKPPLFFQPPAQMLAPFTLQTIKLLRPKYPCHGVDALANRATPKL